MDSIFPGPRKPKLIPFVRITKEIDVDKEKLRSLVKDISKHLSEKDINYGSITICILPKEDSTIQILMINATFESKSDIEYHVDEIVRPIIKDDPNICMTSNDVPKLNVADTMFPNVHYDYPNKHIKVIYPKDILEEGTKIQIRVRQRPGAGINLIDA